MDLSHISFLKPHVINPVVYNLAHEGHTRKALMKSDVVKSIEQQRRYKRFLGTYGGRNTRQ